VILQTPELDTDGVRIDRSGLDFLRIEIVEADISSPAGLHDPTKLAQVLQGLT
jgi:hypothetical protein